MASGGPPSSPDSVLKITTLEPAGSVEANSRASFLDRNALSRDPFMVFRALRADPLSRKTLSLDGPRVSSDSCPETEMA